MKKRICIGLRCLVWELEIFIKKKTILDVRLSTQIICLCRGSCEPTEIDHNEIIKQ